MRYDPMLSSLVHISMVVFVKPNIYTTHTNYVCGHRVSHNIQTIYIYIHIQTPIDFGDA